MTVLKNIKSNQTFKNIDLFSELSFHEELSVAKTSKTFIGYAMT